MDEPLVLKAEKVTKHFEAKTGLLKRTVIRAVESVDLELHKGEILALVGESGSGKTTLGRVIAGMYSSTNGGVSYFGTDTGDAPSLQDKSTKRRFAAQQVQYVFQDPFSSLPPHKKIKSSIYEVLKLYRPKADAKGLEDETKKLLELVGLTPVEQMKEKFPHELSGGQRQRVSFARALAVRPKVLIADEPVSMLDVSIRAGILELMKRLRDGEGLSIIYITHDITTARVISDTIYVLYRGRVVEKGPIDTVVQKPLHPYTITLISSLPGLTLGSGVHVPGRDAPAAKDRSLRSEPPGIDHCVFYARCPIAIELCARERPALRGLADGREVACFLAGSETT